MPTNGLASKIDFAVLEQISDVEFLQALEWEKSVPKELIQSAKDGDVASFTEQIVATILQNRVARNRSSKQQDRFVLESILTLIGETENKELSTIADTISKSGIFADESNHRKNGNRTPKVDTSKANSHLLTQLESLAKSTTPHPALLAILYELIFTFSEKFRWEEQFRLWRSALSIAVQFFREKLPLSEFADREDLQLLVEGELSLKTGLLFYDLKGAKNLLDSGRKYLCSTIEARTDTDGTPHAELIPKLTEWLACFVRTDLWADWFDQDVWDEDSEDRFQSAVRRIAALCDKNGNLALGSQRHCWSAAMLQTGITQAGWKAKSKPAQLLHDIVRSQSTGKESKTNVKPSKWNEEKSPLFQSDWSAVASLRSNWTHRADSVFVTHNEVFPQISLMAEGVTVFSGEWNLELDVDGKRLTLADEWDCSCWFTDKDADFIELQQQVDDVKIDRQIFLSRTDRFAVFADCISGRESAIIDYASALPVTENVTFQKEKTTRECSLKTDQLKLRCFPLLLPEDRIENAGGDYRPHDTGLRLEYKMQGGVFAPQIFDWSPRRKRGHAEWRQLTVTEDGKVMKKHIAGGYRLRLGNRQILLYRSLQQPATGRSVLGHHTIHETVYGIFGPKGEVDPLLLVE